MEIRANLKLSLLAKERGFNECCYSNCWLKKRGKNYEFIEGEYIHNSEARGDLYDRDEPIIQQPTLYQLLHWLMSEHNIYVEVSEYYNEFDLPLSNKKFPKPIGFFFWDKYDDNYCEDSSDKFSSFLIALEKGIEHHLIKYL